MESTVSTDLKSEKLSKRLLIHAGYHKTGTTFLQKNLFVDQKAGFCSPVDRIQLRNCIIRTNPFEFNPTEVRNEFIHRISEALLINLVPVLSHEQFTGQPAGSGYGIRRRQREISRKEVANRLHSCFPEARVLIVNREQRDMIKSIYKFLVSGWQGKLSASIEQFLDQSMLENGYGPLFNLDYLLFHHVIQHYQTLFGSTSVKVLPYELLRNDPLSFINQINRFACNDDVEFINFEKVNESYSASLCTLKRILNRLFASPDKPGYFSKNERRTSMLVKKIDSLIPKKVHERSERKLSEKIAQFTTGKFAESNKKTVLLTKLDLESLGYEMP